MQRLIPKCLKCGKTYCPDCRKAARKQIRRAWYLKRRNEKLKKEANAKSEAILPPPERMAGIRVMRLLWLQRVPADRIEAMIENLIQSQKEGL